MTEGFDPSEAPTRRGRRDPELAARLLDDDDAMGDAGQPVDQTYLGLSAGDTVMGKVTFAARTPLGDAWYTYGAQAQVLSGESSDDAYARVGHVITEGVMDLASDFESTLNEQIEAQREEARHRRIPQN